VSRNQFQLFDLYYVRGEDVTSFDGQDRSGPANKNNSPFQNIVLVYVTVATRGRYDVPWIGKTLLEGARTIYRELEYVQSV
jgi:hypothetical protein